MSKGLGRKISIEFNLPITSIEVGNNKAFIVTGKEYKYVDGPANNGPLLDKLYIVESVVRHPIIKNWTADFLDGVVQDLVAGDSLYIPSNIILESFETETLDPNLTLTGLWARSTQTASVGTYSLESNNKEDSTDSSSYLKFQGRAGQSFSIDYKVSSEDSYDKFYLYHNTTQKIKGISGEQPWKTYKGIATEGINTLRFRYTTDISTSVGLNAGFVDNFITNRGVIETTGTYISEPIIVSGPQRIGWLSEVSNGSSITLEYTIGEVIGVWLPVSNGAVIIVNAKLWLRATLTANTAMQTPVLSSLWLEEIDIRQDLILLTMNGQNSFQSCVEDLTIKYQQRLGNLTGEGGAITDFEVKFRPLDLIAKPNVIDTERLTVSILSTMIVTKVYYSEIENDEYLTASIALLIFTVTKVGSNPL